MAEKVGSIYYDVTMDTRGMIDAERNIGRNLDRAGRHGDRLQAKFSKVAAAITAALSAIAIEGLVSKIVTAQRSFDVMFASLKTMTGGTDQASAAWQRLTKFASTTPYTLQQSVNGFVKLKALGLDPSERAMTSFGNTASAMGKDLTQMIEAVADASTGEFERLKEFGIKAKKEGDRVSLTFRGVTTNIGNNASEITEYLTKIGEVEFAGAMAERMSTLDGNISNLQDSLASLYLSISQAGFGEAVARGVRMATEAITEATRSVEQGGLTEYFDRLRPLIVAAEVASVALAGAIAGRLLAAMVALTVKAYATATAIGVATVAARGFASVMALLGGPIGIAITALGLLAMNWDKVAGEARDAATISEQAAERIANALKRSPGRAAESLTTQLKDVQDELKLIDRELARTGANMASSEDLAELRERRDVLVKVAADIAKARDSLHGGAGRGRITPELIPLEKLQGKPAAATPTTGGGTGSTPSGKSTIDAIGDAERDFERRLEDWWRANEEALDAVDERAAQKVKDAAKGLMDEARANYIATRTPIELLNIELARQQELLDALGPAYRDTYERAVFAAEDAYEAASKIPEELEKANTFAQEFGVTFSSALEDAIVQGGNLRDVMRGLEQDILRIITRRLVTEPLGGAISGAIGGDGGGLLGSVAGFLSGLFGGGLQYGGAASAGSLYRVNERGRPEMFTAANGAQYMLPTQNGRVTPDDRVSSAQPAQTVNHYSITINPPPGMDRRTAQQLASDASRAIDMARSRNG